MTDIENIRTSVEREIQELQQAIGANYDDRREWLKSELETLDKVWEEGRRLKTGLSDWLKISEWQKQYKSAVEPILAWYRLEDPNAAQKDSIKPYLEYAKNWDQRLYWNGRQDFQFWTDCIDVIFSERIEIKPNQIQNLEIHKNVNFISKIRVSTPIFSTVSIFSKCRF